MGVACLEKQGLLVGGIDSATGEGFPTFRVDTGQTSAWSVHWAVLQPGLEDDLLWAVLHYVY